MTAEPDSSDWDAAPCGLLVLAPDGALVRTNATFLRWVGRAPQDVPPGLRLTDLLSVGGRIYWETHLAPLLLVEGRVDEVALELRTPDGRLPVLFSAVASRADDGTVTGVAASVSGARDRSRYERELLAARSAAERSTRQLGALQEVTAALSRAVGVDAVARALVSASVGRLAAASSTVWVVDREHGLVAHDADGESGQPVTLPAGGSVLQGRVAVERDGRVVVPLHGQTSLQGVLSLAPRRDALAEPLDLEVLTAVGQQAGLALDRAQLYEQHAAVARQLQHSLLAAEPPQDDRFAVATTYRPGVEALEVGGDWYDVFVAHDDVLAVVVGDVVGRGLGAASAMGQLRSAVRAVAGPQVGPAQLLRRLDAFVDHVETASMATVAYAELDLDSGRLRYSCAGHPPPVLLPAGGDPRLLWDGRSTPLGSVVQVAAREEAELLLAPGDRLLLYTDGLIERRGRDLDEGLDALVEAAAALGGQSLRDAVTSLTQVLLVDEETRDDVCVLLLTWAGGEFRRDLPGELSQLSGVRHDLREWLAEHDVDSDTSDDVVLAASEALANAVEHGTGMRNDQRVTLRAAVEPRRDGGRDLVLVVHDSGTWRGASVSPDRGRGLLLLAALADHVEVQTADGTTVVLRKAIGPGASA